MEQILGFYWTIKSGIGMVLFAPFNCYKTILSGQVTQDTAANEGVLCLPQNYSIIVPVFFVFFTLFSPGARLPVLGPFLAGVAFGSNTREYTMFNYSVSLIGILATINLY